MEPNKTPNRIHPLVAAASVAVLLASLAAVAAITGILPTSHGTNSPFGALSSSQDTVQLDGSERNPATGSRSKSSSDQRQEQASDYCSICGQIESIQAVQQPAKTTSGVGVVSGAVIGGVLGNQVGAGNGRAIATVAGAVGGGYAGNEIEKRTHTTTTYQVHVRMEDGHLRTLHQSNLGNWRVGDRVKVVNGALTSQG
jgi:outer membrane lipoprotein SlyB